MKFELNLSLEELKKRTSEETFSKIKLVGNDNPVYASLTDSQKECLKHLCRSAKYLDKIHFKMENPHNGEFLNYLNELISNGDERAELTKKLFLAQKSMFSPDIDGNEVILCKGIEKPFGFGYPEDLTVDEFHSIINRMLDEGKIDKVQGILTQRSIVHRDGTDLVGVDYIDEYKEEFTLMAKELGEAKKYSDDKDFNEYLTLQIDALLNADPYKDALADKKWATLDKSVIEYTITRETYNDSMTESIYSNTSLLEKINNYGIEINTKDNIGVRVGIRNNDGTKLLYDLAKLVDVASQYMPYKEEYLIKKSSEEVKQIAVDVDLICLAGEEGAYQAGIVVAQNLPNNDKMSLKIGGGRKNVYHRQIRSSNVDMKKKKKKINKNFIQYFNQEAGHWGTICHENTHSLGPDGNKCLGAYSSILEEFKADMGMYAFLDIFVEKGLFTDLQAKQIMVTELSSCFPKGKPTLAQAHRVRSVMIAKRMIEEKAISFDENGKLMFDFDKIIKTSKVMLAEVIRLQLDADTQKAKEYVEKYFVFDDNFVKMSDLQKKYSKRLNAYLDMPVYDMAIKE